MCNFNTNIRTYFLSSKYFYEKVYFLHVFSQYKLNFDCFRPVLVAFFTQVSTLIK